MVKIVGSYTNVVGLPLYEVMTLLGGEGFRFASAGSTRSSCTRSARARQIRSTMNEINRKISPGPGCPICGRPVETAFKPFCSNQVRGYRSQPLAFRRLPVFGKGG